MALGLVNASAAFNSGERLYRHKVHAHLPRRREALLEITDPLGLGGLVLLVQHKGLTEAQPPTL